MTKQKPLLTGKIHICLTITSSFAVEIDFPKVADRDPFMMSLLEPSPVLAFILYGRWNNANLF